MNDTASSGRAADHHSIQAVSGLSSRVQLISSSKHFTFTFTTPLMSLDHLPGHGPNVMNLKQIFSDQTTSADLC